MCILYKHRNIKLLRKIENSSALRQKILLVFGVSSACLYPCAKGHSGSRWIMAGSYQLWRWPVIYNDLSCLYLIFLVLVLSVAIWVWWRLATKSMALEYQRLKWRGFCRQMAKLASFYRMGIIPGKSVKNPAVISASYCRHHPPHYIIYKPNKSKNCKVLCSQTVSQWEQS